MDWMLVVNLAQLVALLALAIVFLNRQSFGVGQLVQEFKSLTAAFGAHRKEFVAHTVENEKGFTAIRDSVVAVGEKVAHLEGRLAK